MNNTDLPTPQPPAPQIEAYTESNRKTKAFYVTLATVIFLFIGSPMWKTSPNEAINAIIQLASIYIGGLAATDTMRYYKFGSKTLGNPEKQKELQERYKDK